MAKNNQTISAEAITACIDASMNLTEAANHLGISRNKLTRLNREYGLSFPKKPERARSGRQVRYYALFESLGITTFQAIQQGIAEGLTARQIGLRYGVGYQFIISEAKRHGLSWPNNRVMYTRRVGTIYYRQRWWSIRELAEHIGINESTMRWRIRNWPKRHWARSHRDRRILYTNLTAHEVDIVRDHINVHGRMSACKKFSLPSPIISRIARGDDHLLDTHEDGTTAEGILAAS